MPTVERDPPETTTATEATPETSGKRTSAKREKKYGAVKIDSAEIVIPTAEPMTEYHVGTLSTCPMQNVTLAGISFPRTLGGSATDDPERRGARVHLSASQVEAVKKALKLRIVRRGKGPLAPGSLHIVGGRGFTPQMGDEWLAKYVYMVEIAPEVAKALDSEPEAMA